MASQDILVIIQILFICKQCQMGIAALVIQLVDNKLPLFFSNNTTVGNVDE